MPPEIKSWFFIAHNKLTQNQFSGFSLAMPSRIRPGLKQKYYPYTLNGRNSANRTQIKHKSNIPQ